jgi:hypothetical protein
VNARSTSFSASDQLAFEIVVMVDARVSPKKGVRGYSEVYSLSIVLIGLGPLLWFPEGVGFHLHKCSSLSRKRRRSIH